MDDLTILHLSDLHIDSNGRSYSELLKSLLKDIKKQVEAFSNAHFVLVITGDIIDKGDKKALNNAKKFFKSIQETIGNRLAGLYIVPGNHDKCRTEANKLLIPAYRTYFDYQSYCPDKGKKASSGFGESFFENLWDFQKNAYIETGYYELMEYIYDSLFPQFSEIGEVAKKTFGVHVLELEGKKYCFVLYNTAWSCIDDIDSRHIVIGDFQLKKIKEEYDELTDEEDISLTLAMGHHPLNYLYGSEQDSVFDQLIFHEGVPSQAYLCGHTHDRDIINWSNTQHTVHTLMTGIGWPDKSASDSQYHYYSIYNFNLDLNSMDIYVRSTRNIEFRPDLSVYKADTSATHLVHVIKPEKQQPAIKISTAEGNEEKELFLTSSIMESSIKLCKAINNVSTAAQRILTDDFWDFVDNCILPAEKYGEEDLFTRSLLYERFRNIISDANWNTDGDSNLRNIFEMKENKELIYSNFENFLQRLCQSFSEEFLSENDTSAARFHFQYLSDKTSYKYSELCSSFSGADESNKKALDMKYGDLLEAAFNHESSKSLVYSANKNSYERKPDDNEKWENFITIIPDFPENVYRKTLRKNKYKECPYITFGISVDSHHYDNLLYLMDYYKMDAFLSEYLRSYVKCFDINVDEFCMQCRRG